MLIMLITAGIVIFIVIAGLFSIWAWELKRSTKRLRIQKKRLITDKFNLESEKLKFQLQPHTLNNLLAELKATAGRLNKGMESLSETLEYILYKGEGHMASVKEEIEFVESFIALNDIFISEIESIKLYTNGVDQTSLHYNTPSIPHLITGYFIENAFKHGDKNHPNFLNIILKLTQNDFEISVKNQIKRSANTAKGGVGLKNMEERLRLMHPGKFELNFNEVNNEFHSNLKIRFL